MDSGTISISLNAYSTNSPMTKIIFIDPPTEKYYINMKILGVRSLESLGIIPVKRPFIKFDIDSIRSAGEKAYVTGKRYIQTEPLERGPNANILTVLK